MKIGELALATGTSVESIRFYERESLLPQPVRSTGNYRIYDTAHVDRLAFVRHCRSLDMTLDEIRRLLRFKDAPAENCADVNALLDAHVGHVAQRISELRSLQRDLKELRALCRAAAGADCRILQELSQAASRGPRSGPSEHVHVAGAHGRTSRRAR